MKLNIITETKNIARIEKEFLEVRKRLTPAPHFWAYLVFKAIKENKVLKSSPPFQFVRRILRGTARCFYKKVQVKDEFTEATK